MVASCIGIDNHSCSDSKKLLWHGSIGQGENAKKMPAAGSLTAHHKKVLSELTITWFWYTRKKGEYICVWKSKLLWKTGGRPETFSVLIMFLQLREVQLVWYIVLEVINGVDNKLSKRWPSDACTIDISWVFQMTKCWSYGNLKTVKLQTWNPTPIRLIR